MRYTQREIDRCWEMVMGIGAVSKAEFMYWTNAALAMERANEQA